MSQLLEIESLRTENVLSPMTTLAVALSRVGGDLDNQRIVCGTLEELGQQPSENFGEPLHSLIIVGKRLHHLEIEYGEAYAVCKETEYGCTLD